MARIIPLVEIKWEHFSRSHEELEKKVDGVLEQYAATPGPEFVWSHVVVGTFGAGKTQFLFHVFNKALEKGLLPLYFLAEDLFGEIIRGEVETAWLPGNVADLVAEKVSKAKDSISKGDRLALTDILNPQTENATRMMDQLIDRFAHKDASSLKGVLLLDELEQQYRTLQAKVRVDERSPLRAWLERKNHLRFLALAPVGIYEMGGADQTRVGRLVIPLVDITYVREKYFPQDVGKANACWWLSRGKPRHLFKAVERLKDVEISSLETSQAYHIISDELDPIGQEPSKVPPAVLESISATKYTSILDLAPIEGQTARRFCIDMNKFDAGLLAEKLIDALKVGRGNSVLISSYFGVVSRALSDDHGFTYLSTDELAELLALALDLLLEYEHASPGVKDSLREIMSAYEGVRQPILYVSLAPLWDMKETPKQLPLSVREVREAFPFPIMNPIVKNYIPEDIKARWEGKGSPIWKWEEGSITVLFFASWRDFDSYSETDEFSSLALPEGSGVLYILPTDQQEGEKRMVHEWLERNGKLAKAVAPPLPAGFLLSSAGEIQQNIPGDLSKVLSDFQENNEDVILSRKARIYSEAIHDIVKSHLPRPTAFCKEIPPYSDTIWGKAQIGNRAIAIPGCALAFGGLNPVEKALAIQLRELFRGGREGRGAGFLHPFLGRAGHVSIADNLLPHYDRKRELRDSEPITRMRDYFGTLERELADLARLVPLNDFVKLENEEDRNRLLEAFWRATRGELDDTGLGELVERLEMEVVPVASEASTLEMQAIKHLGIAGVDFEDAEKVVRAKDGLGKLSQQANDVIQDKSSGAFVLRSLYKLFISELIDNVERNVRNLRSALGAVRGSLDDLNNASEDLRNNFWQCTKATQFAELKEDDIKAMISQEVQVDGTVTLHELETHARQATASLETLSERFSTLENSLGKLGTAFGGIKEG